MIGTYNSFSYVSICCIVNSFKLFPNRYCLYQSAVNFKPVIKSTFSIQDNSFLALEESNFRYCSSCGLLSFSVFLHVKSSLKNEFKLSTIHETGLTFSLEGPKFQDVANFELIILDNGSIDNIQEICKKFSDQDSRIKFSFYEFHLS